MQHVARVRQRWLNDTCLNFYSNTSYICGLFCNIKFCTLGESMLLWSHGTYYHNGSMTLRARAYCIQLYTVTLVHFGRPM